MKKWEGLVLLKMQALQARADAEHIAALCGIQAQDLVEATARVDKLNALCKASGEKAKGFFEAVHNYCNEKNLEPDQMRVFIQVRPLPKLSYSY
jgi:hypothetical protein